MEKILPAAPRITTGMGEEASPDDSRRICTSKAERPEDTPDLGQARAYPVDDFDAEEMTDPPDSGLGCCDNGEHA